jgi:hydrogenase maturation factor HypF (carbamoyltransferase family)
MTVRPDNRYADSPMVPVACRRCGAQVLARKSSWNQTSVQWNADATANCLERSDADKVAVYGGRGLFLACSALSESIIDAVRRGELAVVDEQVRVRT